MIQRTALHLFIYIAYIKTYDAEGKKHHTSYKPYTEHY